MTQPEGRDQGAPGSWEVLRARHGHHIAEILERQPVWARDFTDLSQEWRRLFAETLGTFLLVVVAAGGAVLDARTPAGVLCLGCLLLRGLFGTIGELGATLPKPGFSSTQAFLIEAVLTLGLVTVILGTASSARNVGPLAALAVGGYIVLAGLWASPVSGASMNPARSLGPDLVRGNLHILWPYLAGPLAGAPCSRSLWHTSCAAPEEIPPQSQQL